MAVWDDHEVADNTWKWGSADSNNTLQGQVGDYEFSERKANAVRAYYEW
jgi:alkaline phosphatase D